MTPPARQFPLAALSGAYVHRTAAREEQPLDFGATDFETAEPTDVRHHKENR
jgi:hypothetical protein